MVKLIEFSLPITEIQGLQMWENIAEEDKQSSLLRHCHHD